LAEKIAINAFLGGPYDYVYNVDIRENAQIVKINERKYIYVCIEMHGIYVYMHQNINIHIHIHTHIRM